MYLKSSFYNKNQTNQYCIIIIYIDSRAQSAKTYWTMLHILPSFLTPMAPSQPYPLMSGVIANTCPSTKLSISMKLKKNLAGLCSVIVLISVINLICSTIFERSNLSTIFMHQLSNSSRHFKY